MTVQVVAPAGGQLGSLAVRHVELLQPGPGQVRVSVRAAGVNPTDWKGVYGSWPRAEPATIGYEVAGVVAAIGTGVAADGPLALGAEVIAYPVFGGYASDVLAAAPDVFVKPAALDFPQAANLLLVGTTAAEMLHVTGIDGDDRTAVVHGASGATGISVLQQLAPLRLRVLATTGERNAALVRSFGAVPVAYGQGLGGRLRALAPDGVQAALDCVGTQEAMDVSLDLVADRTRIVSIANGDEARRRGIRFVDGRDPDSLRYRNAQRARLVAMAAAGQLTVPVARTLPLGDADKAFAVLRSEHPGGKLALVPGTPAAPAPSGA